MIFLDNAGTTQMFDECAKVYSHYACEKFFNPSASSRESARISQELDAVRALVLKKLGALSGKIIFTGGATESNNLAIKGSLRGGRGEYVFSLGEHPSVYNVAKSLEKDRAVKFVSLGKDGKCNLDELEKALSPNVKLISTIFVSNETGAINDIKAISRLRDSVCPNALLHVDAVQAFMKIPFSVEDLKIDLLTFSAHKFHAPKGVGGLYVRDMKALKNIVDGGGQEFGLRSGTENVGGIMAMGKALEKIDVKANFEKVQMLKNAFNEEVKRDGITIYDFNGSPYVEVVSFRGVKGETMLHALEEKGVIVGLGSACSSKKAGNRVLSEIGFKKDEIISCCRISFNAYLEKNDVVTAGKVIKEVYAELYKRLN